MHCKRFLLALVLAGAGCGGVPPFESLSLRDALGSDPEVVAAMSPAAQRDLAQRLLDADAPVEPASPAANSIEGVLAAKPTGDHPDPSAGAADEVRAVDAVRQEAGQDSVMVGVYRSADGRLSLSEAPARGNATTSPLPHIEGAPAVTTADLEKRALGGAAGRRVRQLMDATRADRLQRVVGWPAGAVAIDGVVYVNAAWLVALSALEPTVVLAAPPVATPSLQAAQEPAAAAPTRPIEVPLSPVYGGNGSDSNAADLGADNCALDAILVVLVAWIACDSACEGCSKCETAGHRKGSAATTAWVLLPFAYLWWRSRRDRAVRRAP